MSKWTLLLALLFGAPADDENADAVVQRAVNAVGGREAIEAVQTRTLTGSLLMQGRPAPLTIIQQRPDRILMRAEFPIGVLLRGHDGTTAWEMHPLRGSRVLGEDETAALLRQSSLDGVLDLLDYSTREALEPVAAEGATLLPVRVSDDTGRSETWYFDAATGLPARVERAVGQGPGGPVQVTVHMEDWQPVEGVQVAHRLRAQTATSSLEYRYDSVLHNGEVEPGTFSPPADFSPQP